jgi:hypothetical protein
MHDPIHACVLVQISGNLMPLGLQRESAGLLILSRCQGVEVSEALARGYTFCTLVDSL